MPYKCLEDKPDVSPAWVPSCYYNLSTVQAKKAAFVWRQDAEDFTVTTGFTMTIWNGSQL